MNIESQKEIYFDANFLIYWFIGKEPELKKRARLLLVEFLTTKKELCSSALAFDEAWWGIKNEYKYQKKVNLSCFDNLVFNELKKFEPYGKENPKPKFLTKNLEIVNLEKMGQNQQHLKLLIADDQQKTIKMIGFNFGEKGNNFNIGNKINTVFEIDINEWNGNRELQLKIVDFELTTS